MNTSLFARLHLPLGSAAPGDGQAPRKLSFLHQFQDGVLHAALMVCLMLVVGLALYAAATLTYDFWRLETVVVQGHTQPAK